MCSIVIYKVFYILIQGTKQTLKIELCTQSKSPEEKRGPHQGDSSQTRCCLICTQTTTPLFQIMPFPLLLLTLLSSKLLPQLITSFRSPPNNPLFLISMPRALLECTVSQAALPLPAPTQEWDQQWVCPIHTQTTPYPTKWSLGRSTSYHTRSAGVHHTGSTSSHLRCSHTHLGLVPPPLAPPHTLLDRVSRRTLVTLDYPIGISQHHLLIRGRQHTTLPGKDREEEGTARKLNKTTSYWSI